jgi:transcriptional regulator with XRE-family HTH domain
MPRNDRASFGELLRQHRARAGLTQEALAERAGMSVRGLSDLELGARSAPYPDTIRRLAEALGLDRSEHWALGAKFMPVGISDWVAKNTAGFSGADRAHLCESAAEIALEDSIASGAPRPMTTRDARQVLKDVHPSPPAWFDSARNYAQFANESGVYDDLVAYMRIRKLL